MPWVSVSLPLSLSLSLHFSLLPVNSMGFCIFAVAVDCVHFFWCSVVPFSATGSLLINWYLCSLAWLSCALVARCPSLIYKVLLWPWNQPFSRDPCAIWWGKDRSCRSSLLPALCWWTDLKQRRGSNWYSWIKLYVTEFFPKLILYLCLVSLTLRARSWHCHKYLLAWSYFIKHQCHY